MSRYLQDEELYRITEDEAVNPRTGRKYRLEEIPESSSGFMLGVLVGAIALMFFVVQTSPQFMPSKGSVPLLNEKLMPSLTP